MISSYQHYRHTHWLVCPSGMRALINEASFEYGNIFMTRREPFSRKTGGSRSRSQPGSTRSLAPSPSPASESLSASPNCHGVRH